MPIVNNVADCLVAFAHIYKEELDPEGVNQIIIMVNDLRKTNCIHTDYCTRSDYTYYRFTQCSLEIL